MIVWLNGRFVAEGARIDVHDRGFLLGDGAFETIYVEHGRAAFRSAHLARLGRGLSELRIPSPRLNGLRDVLAELAARNEMELAAARLTVSRGPGPRGLLFEEDATATVLITLAPALPAAPDPLRLHVASSVRCSDSWSFKAIGGQLPQILAADEARSAGSDEAILLNARGGLACAAAANIFIIDEEGRAATPPTSEGALPGIVRAVLLDGQSAHDVQCEERPIELGEVKNALIVLTNSLRGVRRAVVEGGGSRPSAAQDAAFDRLTSYYAQALRRSLAEDE